MTPPSPWLTFGISVVSLVTSSVGWLVVHRLTLRRERDNRKRKFVALLYKWQQEVARTPEHELDKVWDGYKKMAVLCWSEQSEVRADFEPTAEFDRLADRLCNFRFEDLTKTKPTLTEQGRLVMVKNAVMRDIIADAIKELKGFCESSDRPPGRAAVSRPHHEARPRT
jgi:hypothetical protein